MYGTLCGLDLQDCMLIKLQVIVMAFLIRVNGPGGAPIFDFTTATKDCPTFPGTRMPNCPGLG